MLCKSARLVLRAYKEDDVSARLDYVMKAFWDNTDDADDILQHIERTCADLRSMKITPIIPIIHCNKLHAALTDFLLKRAGDDMPYDWFVSTVLRATNWLEGADCDAYTASYLNPHIDEEPDVEYIDTHEPPEDPLDEDIGFSVMLPAETEPRSVSLFHFVFGAVCILRALCMRPA